MIFCLQANSIKNSDKITNGKRAKGGDFTEHENILKQALAGNPCNERRMATTGKIGFAFAFNHFSIFSFDIITNF